MASGSPSPLARTPFAFPLEDAQLARLLECFGKPVELEQNSVVWEEKKCPSFAFVVFLEGTANVTFQTSHLCTKGAGDYIWQASSLIYGHRKESLVRVVAKTRCRVRTLSAESLANFLVSLPGQLAANVVAALESEDKLVRVPWLTELSGIPLTLVKHTLSCRVYSRANTRVLSEGERGSTMFVAAIGELRAETTVYLRANTRVLCEGERGSTMFVAAIGRANTRVLCEGERGSTMFVAVIGELRAETTDVSGDRLYLRKFKPGDAFGEVAVAYQMPRTANVLTTSDRCLIFCLSHEAMRGFFTIAPKFEAPLMSTTRRRATEGLRKFKIPFFSFLRESDMAELGDYCKIKMLTPGAALPLSHDTAYVAITGILTSPACRSNGTLSSNVGDTERTLSRGDFLALKADAGSAGRHLVGKSPSFVLTLTIEHFRTFLEQVSQRSPKMEADVEKAYKRAASFESWTAFESSSSTPSSISLPRSSLPPQASPPPPPPPLPRLPPFVKATSSPNVGMNVSSQHAPMTDSSPIVKSSATKTEESSSVESASSSASGNTKTKAEFSSPKPRPPTKTHAARKLSKLNFSVMNSPAAPLLGNTAAEAGAAEHPRPHPPHSQLPPKKTPGGGSSCSASGTSATSNSSDGGFDLFHLGSSTPSRSSNSSSAGLMSDSLFFGSPLGKKTRRSLFPSASPADGGARKAMSSLANDENRDSNSSSSSAFQSGLHAAASMPFASPNEKTFSVLNSGHEDFSSHARELHISSTSESTANLKVKDILSTSSSSEGPHEHHHHFDQKPPLRGGGGSLPMSSLSTPKRLPLSPVKENTPHALFSYAAGGAFGPVNSPSVPVSAASLFSPLSPARLGYGKYSAKLGLSPMGSMMRKSPPDFGHDSSSNSSRKLASGAFHHTELQLPAPFGPTLMADSSPFRGVNGHSTFGMGNPASGGMPSARRRSCFDSPMRSVSVSSTAIDSSLSQVFQSEKLQSHTYDELDEEQEDRTRGAPRSSDTPQASVSTHRRSLPDSPSVTRSAAASARSHRSSSSGTVPNRSSSLQPDHSMGDRDADNGSDFESESDFDVPLQRSASALIFPSEQRAESSKARDERQKSSPLRANARHNNHFVSNAGASIPLPHVSASMPLPDMYGNASPYPGASHYGSGKGKGKGLGKHGAASQTSAFSSQLSANCNSSQGSSTSAFTFDDERRSSGGGVRRQQRKRKPSAAAAAAASAGESVDDFDSMLDDMPLSQSVRSASSGGQAKKRRSCGPPNRSISPDDRRRMRRRPVATACERCHKAKARCDAARPCGRCVSMDAGASCVDHISRRRKSTAKLLQQQHHRQQQQQHSHHSRRRSATDSKSRRVSLKRSTMPTPSPRVSPSFSSHSHSSSSASAPLATRHFTSTRRHKPPAQEDVAPESEEQQQPHQQHMDTLSNPSAPTPTPYRHRLPPPPPISALHRSTAFNTRRRSGPAVAVASAASSAAPAASEPPSASGAHQRSHSMTLPEPTHAASATSNTTSSSVSSSIKPNTASTGAAANSSALPPLPPLPVSRQPPLAVGASGGNAHVHGGNPAAFGHFPLPSSHFPFSAAAMGVPPALGAAAAAGGGGLPPHHRFAMSAPLPHRFNTAAHAHANAVAAARAAAAAAAFSVGQNGYLPQVPAIVPASAAPHSLMPSHREQSVAVRFRNLALAMLEQQIHNPMLRQRWSTVTQTRFVSLVNRVCRSCSLLGASPADFPVDPSTQSIKFVQANTDAGADSRTDLDQLPCAVIRMTLMPSGGSTATYALEFNEKMLQLWGEKSKISRSSKLRDELFKHISSLQYHILGFLERDWNQSISDLMHFCCAQPGGAREEVHGHLVQAVGTPVVCRRVNEYKDPVDGFYTGIVKYFGI